MGTGGGGTHGEPSGVDGPATSAVVVGIGTPLTLPGIAVLGTVASADALTGVRRLRPDVVVVDLDADERATVAVGALAAEVPEVPVVAVSARAEHSAVLDVVRAGAAGYVLRDDPAVADIIRSAASGGVAFGQGLAEIVLESVADPGAVAVPHLTERESEVLRFVVEGLTARQIATRLVLSPRTVENHIQRTLRKLDVPGRAALVRYAIEHGLA
ncbi:MAG: response regulator transcription factor [Pseudonocardia sp.]|nr:response regulator transcription factor [Pseudonocardia sp.]